MAFPSPQSPSSRGHRLDKGYHQIETLGRPRRVPSPVASESGLTDDWTAIAREAHDVGSSRRTAVPARFPSSSKGWNKRQSRNIGDARPNSDFLDAESLAPSDIPESPGRHNGNDDLQRQRSMAEKKRLNRSSANFSRRLSVASKRLSDSWEYQGWSDPTALPTIPGTARRPNSRIQFDVDSSIPESKGAQATSKSPAKTESPDEAKPKYGFRFWMVMLALCVTQLLNALEGTVTSTALPTIVEQLGGGDEFIWASSGYFLTSTVFQPLYGQMADIFGRRWLIMFAVGIFVIGSAISGAAPTMGVLIVGRIIQGSGGGGINVVVNIIISDLVPLRDRGKFLAIVFAAISVGTSIGPIMGGIIVQNTTWRWVFFLNIPVGCASLALLFVFLKVSSVPSSTLKEKLKQIDYGGNVIFITGVSFILVALTYSGTLWAWTSYQTIVSLVFGVFALAGFILYEGSNWCVKPTVPLRLFGNRTSASAYALTFLHSMLTLLVIYYLPVYFQAALLASTTTSGVDMLPTVVIMVPLSAISGVLLSKLGRYKPFHYAGFALLALGLGCFITLNASSPTVAWVLVQVVAAIGAGLVLSTLLPAVQAELPEGDIAAATGTWAFMRSFGIVWGVSVPAAIFNAQFDQLSYRIPDAGARAQLSGGAAYEHATADFLNTFEPALRRIIQDVYADSLKVVWIFATAMAGLGLLLVFLERETVLRTKLETKFGLEDEKKAGGQKKHTKHSISREPLVERDIEMA